MMGDAIQVSGLTYRYGRQQVLDPLTFSVPEGAVYGLLGPNGSGKSTTLRLLMGLLRRDGGVVDVLGLDPVVDPVAVKRAVGYVAESQGFYPWMRVGELLDFVGGVRPDWDPPYATHLLGAFRLTREARIRELSKGQRAMVALLVALAFRPRLLLLDEPTASLDPRARGQFFESVLREYQAEGGTILISSHQIHEIAGLVDHVGILDRGRLIVSATEEALRAQVSRYTLTFADAAPSVPIDCPGVLRQVARGRQIVLSVRRDASPDDAAEGTAVRAALDAVGALRVTVEPLGLEEIFLELTAEGG
ncbi:MAG: ABC transporter ATP-binding protein [Acidobacteriota bacterium]